MDCDSNREMCYLGHILASQHGSVAATAFVSVWGVMTGRYVALMNLPKNAYNEFYYLP